METDDFAAVRAELFSFLGFTVLTFSCVVILLGRGAEIRGKDMQASRDVMFFGVGGVLFWSQTTDKRGENNTPKPRQHYLMLTPTQLPPPPPTPKGGRGCLMSQSCHLIPLYCLLSCSSV